MSDDTASAPDAAAHVSYDELAEFDEALLPDIRRAEVEAHLPSCGFCRARLAAVADARRALAAQPAMRMPDDVRDRLDAALTAAAPEPGQPAPVTSDVAPVTVIPRAVRRRPLVSSSTVAAVAASFVVIAAIVAVVVGHHRHHGTSDATAGGAVAAPQSSTLVRPHALAPSEISVSSTDDLYSGSNLGALAATLVTTPQLAPTAPVTLPPDQSDASPAPSPSATGTGTGAEATGGPGRASSSGALSSTDKQPVAHSLQHLYDSRAALLDCAAVVTDTPGAVPAAVDFGRWSKPDGTVVPAAILVFRQSDDEGVAYAIGASCQGTDQLLGFHTVALP